MYRLKQYRTDILLLFSFFLLPLLLFGDVTLGGKTMLPLDNLFQWWPWSAHAASFNIGTPQNSLINDLLIENYVWKQFMRDTIFAGDIPLWNPYLFAGVPFLAAGQHAAYYPFSILFLILPLVKAYGWYTVSQLWLAGVLMYVYGRLLNLRRSSAFLAGLIYQGGGYIVVSAAVFPMIIGAVVWLPLLLGCVGKVASCKGQVAGGKGQPRLGQGPPKIGARDRVTLWVLLGGVALGMQILAGHIEFTIYTLLIMAFYAAWQLLSTIHYPTINYLKTICIIGGHGDVGANVGGDSARAAVRARPGQLSSRSGFL